MPATPPPHGEESQAQPVLTLRRQRRWRLLVPVICVGAGFLFAVSARNASGGAVAGFRPPGIGALRSSVLAAEREVRAENAQLASVQRRVGAATHRAGRGNGAVRRTQAEEDTMLAPAGRTAMTGPGLEVVLDDAPPSDATVGVDPNQLVVHQSDLQAVVNALWAGGAEAVSVANQRLVATSAVRCVGNTLLLNGEVFSPPYRVLAIGPSASMQQQLAASPGVQLFEQAAGYFGLGYTVQPLQRLTVPAFRGPIVLQYAVAGR